MTKVEPCPFRLASDSTGVLIDVWDIVIIAAALPIALGSLGFVAALTALGVPEVASAFEGGTGRSRASSAIAVAVALAALAMGDRRRPGGRPSGGRRDDRRRPLLLRCHCVAGITVAWVVPGDLDGPDVPGGHAIGRGAGCRIWIDTGYFDSASWGAACALVVHEAGHALGYGHSSNPASVMHSLAPASFAPCEGASPQ